MKKMYLALTVFAISMSQLMAQFSGGDGSLGDPYQIATKMDLKELMEVDSYWGDNFVQTDDIVFDALDFDEIVGDFFWLSGFKTIGTSMTPFTGTYEGNNHTISNLEMYSSSALLGLFGYTFGATISNLGLINVYVSSSHDNSGAIIGYAYGTTLTNCYSTGTVLGYYSVGGLVGYTNECEVTDCYSSAVVSVEDEYAGGLVGSDEESVFTNCYATGNVVSYYSYAGGLIGYANNSEFTDCYATGNVSVDSRYAGGLIGYAYYLTITDCYATGDTEAVLEHNGGLLAYSSYSIITNCYAEGNAIGYQRTGGLIGYSYYDVISFCNASGEVTASSDYSGGLIGDASGSTISNSSATGNITSEGYYAGGLIGYSDNTGVSVSYATGDVTSTEEEAGGLIGYSSNGNIINSYATGNVIGEYNVGGLIGYARNGNVVDSYATGNVIGEYSVGGLIGFARFEGLVNCYATGSVEAFGDYSAGGLIGEAENNTTIEECYATGSVVGLDYVGGLVGYANDVQIFNSYATGDVSGSDVYVGGLVGFIYFSQITNSYSVGSVTGPGDIGGLIGYNDNGTVNDSFYDEETSGQNDNDGRGEPRSTADMKTESTFTDANWDFVAIWQMDLGCPNDGYPIFVSQETQIRTIEPTLASATQDFCENSTIANIDVTGDNIQWYDQENGNVLNESTLLTDATSYFATQTIDGCESNPVEVMVVINTTPILDPVSDLSECDSYELPVLTVGNYYTAANAGGAQMNDGDVITDSQTIFVYAENAGCPAESSFDLTIIELPSNTVTVATNGTMSADEIAATYQWIDCDNMNSPISGEVNQFFIPASSGNYAVEVTKNGCSITSDCTPITISNVGFDENSLNQIAVYPNPSNGEFTVNLGDINDATIVVRDLAGKEVYRSHTTSSIVEVQLLEATGIYFLEVLTASNSKTIKIVKH